MVVMMMMMRMMVMMLIMRMMMMITLIRIAMMYDADNTNNNADYYDDAG